MLSSIYLVRSTLVLDEAGLPKLSNDDCVRFSNFNDIFFFFRQFLTPQRSLPDNHSNFRDGMEEVFLLTHLKLY